MKKITAIALFKIHPGKLDEFKKLAPELIKAVKRNETGAIMYDWFLNEDTMECTVLETYADSQAVMAHVGNTGPLLQQLDEISDLSLQVFGNPDPQLGKMIQDMGARHYPFFSGLESR